MRFAADEMLGKLARWLRVSGHDVTYERYIDDGHLIRQARDEGRIILTRDTHLIERLQKSEYLFIHYDHLKDQLQEFYEHFFTTAQAARLLKPLYRMQHATGVDCQRAGERSGVALRLSTPGAVHKLSWLRPHLLESDSCRAHTRAVEQSAGLELIPQDQNVLGILGIDFCREQCVAF